MRHYLFVGDRREVLGVWEAKDEMAATRLRLQLALMYPDCETITDHAHDFESFKAGYRDYDFGGLQPDREGALSEAPDPILTG
jgi:hypothetical protein